ncbi:MAG: ABC transporter ATP-binding protein [Cytophagales bacterium]|jgi:ABC-2 type transport system ATP-binding protein|nr:ABC transporter ATP-binding protein [Cytophagales bacterium]
MIELNDLRKTYDGRRYVLDGVSVLFGERTTTGIIGANGAGKTTLFNCICGLEKPTSGRISPDRRLHTIGYLPTELYFYPRIKANEHLLFCLKAQKKSVSTETINKWAELLELPLMQYAEEYSTGMKKKLALLTLLLADYPVYLLDEPFNGLDLASNLLLKQIISRLQQADKTIILTSHILPTLTDVCDEIHYLANGVFARKYALDEFQYIEKDMVAFTMQAKIDALEQLL